MRSKFCWSVVASLAVCLGVAGQAEATSYGNLDAQWNGVSLGLGVTIHAYPGTQTLPGTQRQLGTTGGVYNFIKLGTAPTPQEQVTGLGTGDPFHTHCIDIQEYVGGLEQWEVMDVQDAPHPNTLLGSVTISPAKETLLQKLFFLVPDSVITTQPTSALKNKYASARQIAVWEIVFEHWKGLDALDSTSSFWVTNDGGAGLVANAMMTAVATYSWQVGDSMPILYAFVDRNSSDQDQLWLSPVGGSTYIPEPLTMLGMFLGLGSVGAYIRKRRMA